MTDEPKKAVQELICTIQYGVGVIDNPTAFELDFGGEHTLLISEAVWRRCKQVNSWRPLGQMLTAEEKAQIGWAKRGAFDGHLGSHMEARP